jgi:hypothetical protein
MAPPDPRRENPAVSEDDLMLSYFLKKITMFFDVPQRRPNG